MPVAEKIAMKIIAVSIKIPVTMVTKKAIEKAWLAARPEDPPRKARDADVGWADAVTWGAMSAVGLVTADLVTRRGSESVYRAIFGTEPPAKAADTPKKLKEAETQDRIADRRKRREKSARTATKKAKKQTKKSMKALKSIGS